MPRRKTEHDGHVPLWLVPHILLQWIRKFGEDLEWIRVRRSCHHFYTVSIRIRSIKREFSHRAAATAEAG